MYSLDQLKMFVAAAETGSFSAAARHLGKAQSAVSTGIANLEIDLGVELFDRSSRKPGLTDEGDRMLGHARAVLQQTEALDLAAASLFSGAETRLRLVIDDALLLPTLSGFLIEFGNRFPATQIDILSAVSPDIPAMIDGGAAEIGLMFSGGRVQEGLEQAFIGNLPFLAVSAIDHPLARMASIGAGDLLPHRQLLLRSGGGGRLDQFPELSAQVWHGSSFHTLRELTLQGVGWAYLPAHFAGAALAAGQLAKLKLRFEHKHWSPPVELVTRRHTAMGLALTWLAEQLKHTLS